MKMSTMASYQEIAQSMGGASKIMTQMNEQMDVKQIQNVLKEFTKESAKAEMQQDMVNDAMEMGMDNVEEEADDVYNGILGEIGLEFQEG